MIRDASSNELFTILIVVCLVIVAMAKLVSSSRFSDFIYVFANSKYLKIYARDQKFFDKFDALLFSNSVISLAIFVAIGYEFFYGSDFTSINIMFKLVIGIGAFLLIKVLIERLLGSLFEIDSLIDEYLFQKITYKNFLGLILLPINALLIYSFEPSKILFYCMMAILIIFISSGLFTSFKRHQSLLKNNLFYFILYLCALEIAPYIVLYKVFISK